MSATLPQVRARVEVLLRNTDAKKPTFSPVEVDQAIRGAYITVQGRLPKIEGNTDSAGTISAGADTFALPSTSNYQYGGLVKIRLRSTGQFLYSAMPDELDAMRDGNSTVSLGIPRYFAIWEDSSQVVQGRCYPGAQVAEAYDLHRSSAPQDFDLTAMDSTVIALSVLGLNALVYKAALNLGLTMTDEDLRLRRLNPRVFEAWQSDYQVCLHDEAVRRNNLESVGRSQRWLATPR